MNQKRKEPSKHNSLGNKQLDGKLLWFQFLFDCFLLDPVGIFKNYGRQFFIFEEANNVININSSNNDPSFLDDDQPVRATVVNLENKVMKADILKVNNSLSSSSNQESSSSGTNLNKINNLNVNGQCFLSDKDSDNSSTLATIPEINRNLDIDDFHSDCTLTNKATSSINYNAQYKYQDYELTDEIRNYKICVKENSPLPPAKSLFNQSIRNSEVFSIEHVSNDTSSNDTCNERSKPTFDGKCYMATKNQSFGYTNMSSNTRNDPEQYREARVLPNDDLRICEAERIQHPSTEKYSANIETTRTQHLSVNVVYDSQEDNADISKRPSKLSCMGSLCEPFLFKSTKFSQKTSSYPQDSEIQPRSESQVFEIRPGQTPKKANASDVFSCFTRKTSVISETPSVKKFSIKNIEKNKSPNISQDKSPNISQDKTTNISQDTSPDKLDYSQIVKEDEKSLLKANTGNKEQNDKSPILKIAVQSNVSQENFEIKHNEMPTKNKSRENSHDAQSKRTVTNISATTDNARGTQTDPTYRKGSREVQSRSPVKNKSPSREASREAQSKSPKSDRAALRESSNDMQFRNAPNDGGLKLRVDSVGHEGATSVAVDLQMEDGQRKESFDQIGVKITEYRNDAKTNQNSNRRPVEEQQMVRKTPPRNQENIAIRTTSTDSISLQVDIQSVGRGSPGPDTFNMNKISINIDMGGQGNKIDKEGRMTMDAYNIILEFIIDELIDFCLSDLIDKTNKNKKFAGQRTKAKEVKECKTRANNTFPDKDPEDRVKTCVVPTLNNRPYVCVDVGPLDDQNPHPSCKTQNFHCPFKLSENRLSKSEQNIPKIRCSIENRNKTDQDTCKLNKTENGDLCQFAFESKRSFSSRLDRASSNPRFDERYIKHVDTWDALPNVYGMDVKTPYGYTKGNVCKNQPCQVLLQRDIPDYNSRPISKVFEVDKEKLIKGLHCKACHNPIHCGNRNEHVTKCLNYCSSINEIA